MKKIRKPIFVAIVIFLSIMVVGANETTLQLPNISVEQIGGDIVITEHLETNYTIVYKTITFNLDFDLNLVLNGSFNFHEANRIVNGIDITWKYLYEYFGYAFLPYPITVYNLIISYPDMVYDDIVLVEPVSNPNYGEIAHRLIYDGELRYTLEILQIKI